MRRIAVAAGVLVAAAVAAIALLHVPGTAERVVSAAGRARSAGLAGLLAFGAVFVLATLVFVPQLAVTIPAGFSYGLVEGFALSIVTSFIAACVAFALGRGLLRARISRRFGRDPRVVRLEHAVRDRGFFVVALLRLSPMFPFAVVNYLMALTAVRPRAYVLGTAIGLVPNTLLYVYLGSIAPDAVAMLRGQGATPWHVILPLASAFAVTAVLAHLARRVLAA